MSDLEHILEEEYAKKANESTLITPSMLMEMVEGVLDEAAAHKASCSGVKPKEDFMRFEYVVIGAARRSVGLTEPLIAQAAEPGKIHTSGKKKGKERTSKEQEKALAQAEKVALRDTEAYACSQREWYRNSETGELTGIGTQADNVVKTCDKSGYFNPKDFAMATMSGVEKTVPAWGGTAIEPKTDIMFGKKRISLKMSGGVQAASAEAKNSLKVLEHVTDSWLKKNARITVVEGVIAVAQEEVRTLFEGIQEELCQINL